MTDSAMTGLTCPKCESSMRSYERSGIVIDQCTGCRGLFLDRGELERLTEAEDAHYAGAAGGRERARTHAVDQEADDHPERGGSGRRRGGFLGDLFEFGD